MGTIIVIVVAVILGAVLYHNKTKLEADLSAGLVELEALVAKGETVASADVKALVAKLKAKI